MAKRRSSRLRWVIGGAAVAAAAVLGTRAVLSVARPAVTVTEAAEGPVVQAFYATGTVSPDDENPINSNIAGIVTDVRVRKGSAVQPGDVLAVVASDELQFKLRQAEAELAEKKGRSDEKTSPVLAEFDAKIAGFSNQLEISNREIERLRPLVQKNAASLSDLDLALRTMTTSDIDVGSAKAQRAAKLLELQRETAVAQAARDIAAWNADQQTIRSPVAGVVLDRPVPVGTRLAIKDHVMQIADVRPAKLVMRAQVDEEDKAKVRVGGTVRMTLYSFPGSTFTGEVARAYDKADPDRRTFEVDVRPTYADAYRHLFNTLLFGHAPPFFDPPLAPGMTGELAFVTAEKARAVVVPSQAVQKGTVWVVRGGRLAKADVKLGLRSVERVEVLSGLLSGDEVVVSAVGDLPAGKTVRVAEKLDPATAAGLNKPKSDEGKFKGFQG